MKSNILKENNQVAELFFKKNPNKLFDVTYNNYNFIGIPMLIEQDEDNNYIINFRFDNCSDEEVINYSKQNPDKPLIYSFGVMNSIFSLKANNLIFEITNDEKYDIQIKLSNI